MTAFVTALLIKLTLVLTVGLVVSAISRRLSPSVRHLILYATLVIGALLPLAMWMSPEWNVPILPRAAATPAITTNTSTATLSANGFKAVASHPSSEAGEISAPLSSEGNSGPAALELLPLLPLLWAIGFAAVIAWLVVGHTGLRRIVARSWPLDSTEWKTILQEERAYAGVAKPVILRSSSAISTPLTFGVRSPVVLLPEDALEWSEAHGRIVLRHELAHVARTDSLTQLAAGLVCAIYWFHPLVWITERRLRAECERACDDSVVSLGTPAAEYAAHLLEVARSARAFGAAGFLSVAMARPSQLEGRLLAVLSESRRRVSLSKRARPVAAVLSALILLPLAAFRAVPSPDASSQPLTSEMATGSKAHDSPGNEASAISVQPSTEKPQQIRADTTFQLSVPASSGGTLALDLKTGGKIIITGWDRQEVSVRASLSGRDWRATKVTLEPTVGGGARLASEFTASGSSQSSSHVFEIKMPRHYNATISSAGGSVSIADVDGTFEGQTGGGEINIQRANGKVDIQTGGGDIHVSDSRVDGNVSTGGGVVRIEGVTGNIVGMSGSGPVIQSKSSSTSVRHESGVTLVSVDPGDSEVHVGTGSGKGSGQSTGTISGRSISYTRTNDGISTTTRWSDDDGSKSGFARSGIAMSMAGGPISLAAAPDGARVTTGGGRIRIGPSGGEVYAMTGGGDIDIGPATGSVEAHTGAGDVTIELKGAGAHSVNATSGRGQVVLVVPRDLDATLELESAYTNNLGHKTRIVSDFPLQTTETADWDSTEGTPRRYVRARQTLGKGGGIIRVRTVNGNVVVNRAR